MITIKDWTMKDPLNCIGFNMATCYGTKTSDPEKNIKRAKTHLESHGRLQELPDVYMIIEGYSAKCLRELYTHIGGSPTRMQASTRYIDYSKDKNFAIITPPKIEKNEKALKAWNEHMKNTQALIADMIEMGVPVEDATMALPLAYESKMIWKVNLRCLVNFMNMRLCTRAYWEIRNLANELKKALSEYSDEWKYICDLLLVPKCEALGYCAEHESCGRQMSKERLEAKADGYDILQDFLCELPFSVEDCLDSEGKEILRIADGE